MRVYINKLAVLGVVLLAMVSPLGCDGESDDEAPPVVLFTVTYEQVNTWIVENAAIALIDVRPAEQYVQGHIERARNIPFETLQDEYGQLIDGGSALTTAVPNKDQVLVIYCEGWGNDTKTGQIAIDLGYTKVYYYEGGTPDWDTRANYYVKPHEGFKTWHETNYPYQSGTAYLVDVLSQADYEGGPGADLPFGHIPCAINIDSDTWVNETGLIDNGQAFSSVIPDKTAEIVVYCIYETCGRDTTAARGLAEMGYTNVYRYKDGIKGWKQNGGETITGPDPCPAK